MVNGFAGRREFTPLLSTALLGIAWILTAPLPVVAQPNAETHSRIATRNVMTLFGEEIRDAATKLKWRGERLADDTAYAAAVTGITWERAWGKEHLFSLAWGDCRKVPTLGKRKSRQYPALVEEIQRHYESRNYAQAVAVAAANFSPEEISCDLHLKKPVGDSLLALRQPERAFPILSAPFEPPPNAVNLAEMNRAFRESAFDAALRAGLTKESIAFALSLALEPGTDPPRPHGAALRYLEQVGVDIDRVLLGILQAPERLRGLPAYSYAAADLLVSRASPRYLPLFIHLVESDDVYFRSRALLGLGVLAYRAYPGEPAGWGSQILNAPLREYGLSAGERKRIDQEIRDAANSRNYRLRAAAALALALVDAEEAIPLLQKLAKDRAYILSPQEKDRSRPRRLLFPVRTMAAAGLSRFGVRVEVGNGEFAGRELDRARRGGQDVTNDRGDLRRNIVSRIAISPLDAALAAPIEPPRR